jgi:hypothetical protein
MQKPLQAFVLTLLFAVAGLAQGWEFGGSGGFGFLSNVSARNSIGTATTGFQPGAAFGAVLTQNMYDRLSGEVRYTYRMSDLRITGGGQEAKFKGLAHVVHYDVVYHTAKRSAAVRPFVAVGGGMKMFRGTGKEAPYQPLSEFAILTRTQQVQPVLSFGAGTRIQLSPRVVLRIEFRDYFTRFPDRVIEPVPGTTLKGWLHDITPLIGISYTFD